MWKPRPSLVLFEMAFAADGNAIPARVGRSLRCQLIELAPKNPKAKEEQVALEEK